MQFAVLDFETAASYRDSACALGLCVVESGRVASSDHWLIRPPDNYFDDFNVAIHGIRPEMTADAPSFAEIFAEAWKCADGLPLVAHNAAFDMSVLRYGLDSAGVAYPTADYYCTMLMARAHWPDLPAYSLPMLSAFCDIPLDHHNAESDSLAAARLLLRIADERGRNDLSALAADLTITPGFLDRHGYTTCACTALKRQVRPKTSVRDIPVNPDADTDHPFYDADVAFTGTLLSMSRDEAMRIVADRGGRPRTMVSRLTEYLVVGSVEYRSLETGEPSRKMQKAIDLRASGCPVVILSEKDFLEYL